MVRTTQRMWNQNHTPIPSPFLTLQIALPGKGCKIHIADLLLHDNTCANYLHRFVRASTIQISCLMNLDVSYLALFALCSNLWSHTCKIMWRHFHTVSDTKTNAASWCESTYIICYSLSFPVSLLRQCAGPLQGIKHSASSRKGHNAWLHEKRMACVSGGYQAPDDGMVSLLLKEENVEVVNAVHHLVFILSVKAWVALEIRKLYYTLYIIWDDPRTIVS